MKSAPLQNSIIIGHTHGLKEARLLVMGDHPHCSLSFFFHSNLNPDGLEKIKYTF